MTNSSKRWDVIVVGMGGMGSAAAYHLAKRGKRVLGLEQFDIPHDFGSSHGLTRIIRLAYFEHPTYVPLLRRAYTLWRELQQEVHEELLCITGSLDVGRPGSPVFDGSVTSCNEHNLPHEILSWADIGLRFPGFRLPAGFQAVLQQDGGFLLSERCIVSHVVRAQVLDAEIRAREGVLDWSPTSEGGVRVRTTRGTYEGDRLVIAGGAWAPRLVPGLAEHAKPERQVLAWFQPKKLSLYALGSFPVFNLTVDEGHFYGFPVFGIPGFKIGLFHHLREQVEDPDAVDRNCYDRDEVPLRECVEKYFPEAAGPTMSLKTCMFTNTRDEHFVIDTLADTPQVAVAAGFSGHGFKFASVVGEILADLAMQGTSQHDISLFAASRLASPI